MIPGELTWRLGVCENTDDECHSSLKRSFVFALTTNGGHSADGFNNFMEYQAMTMQEFIFSEKSPHRIKRHLAFLGVLGVAFFLQSIVPGHSIFSTAFFSLCCFFPICIFSVYTCIYYLYSSFLQKKKYRMFFLGFILLGMACLFLNYLAAGLFLKLADDFGKPGTTTSEQMNLSFVNTTHALIIGGLALGIKLAKNIYLRQKENSQLSRQKIVTDLRLEKARIYPRLLYQSLDNLRSGINAGSANASTQVLKVSELLSYILYDNDEKWVSLEKELAMMQHLIDIEQSGRSGHPELRMNVSGDPTRKFIVPMTLFPLLENFFKIMENKTAGITGVNLDLYIKNSDLDLRLAIHKTANYPPVHQWNQVFAAVGQRFETLYPGSYQIKVIDEGQVFIVLLNVILKNSYTVQDHPAGSTDAIYAEA